MTSACKWELDKSRTYSQFAGSSWGLNFNSSLECLVSLPSILHILIGAANFQNTDMTVSILNALRRPWRVFCYNLVDAEGAPICTEKVFLDYLASNPSMETDENPTAWIAKQYTFRYKGNDYSTDFFTPLNSDLIRFSMTGSYMLIRSDGETEFYTAGRELYKQTPLQIKGDPSNPSRINNTFYVECSGNGMDDTLAYNVSQMNTLFQTLGGQGIYFPFNLQNDLPQNPGYTDMRIMLEISLNVQNVVKKTKWFYSNFQLDVDRAPNTYTNGSLNFDQARDAHLSHGANTCIGATMPILNRPSRYLFDSFNILQGLINDISIRCRTQRYSDLYDTLSKMKQDVIQCQKYLNRASNVALEQSEGFLQMIDLVTKVAGIVASMETMKREPPSVWKIKLEGELNLETLKQYAGSIYSEEISRKKRPLYVEELKRIKRNDDIMDNITSSYPNLQMLVSTVVLTVLVFLLFLSAGYIVHASTLTRTIHRK